MDWLLDLFKIDTLMVTVFGYALSYLEAAATVFTLVCVIFAARANIATFAFGIISIILSFIFFYQAHLYSSMALQVIFLSFNVYGYFEWTRPKEGQENDKNQLKVTLYPSSKYLLFAGLILVGTILWGLFMSNPPEFLANEFTEAKYPYIDAFILVASLVGQYMLMKKKLENWVVWTIIDVVATGLYAASGATFMAILYAILVLNALYGWYEWNKMYKNNI